MRCTSNKGPTLQAEYGLLQPVLKNPLFFTSFSCKSWTPEISEKNITSSDSVVLPPLLSLKPLGLILVSVAVGHQGFPTEWHLGQSLHVTFLLHGKVVLDFNTTATTPTTTTITRIPRTKITAVAHSELDIKIQKWSGHPRICVPSLFFDYPQILSISSSFVHSQHIVTSGTGSLPKPQSDGRCGSQN